MWTSLQPPKKLKPGSGGVFTNAPDNFCAFYPSSSTFNEGIDVTRQWDIAVILT